MTAISFVPENDVLERFLELVDSFPDLEHVDELIAYFEVTYIQGPWQGNGSSQISLKCENILKIQPTMFQEPPMLLKDITMGSILSFFPSILACGSFWMV